MNWLLSGATTTPTTQTDDDLTTRPSVLASPDSTLAPTRPGEIILSDGTKLSGQLSTTMRQPLHLWVAEQGKFVDVPFLLVKSIEVRVVWEGQEKDWNFAQSGLDTKVFSEKSHPARETNYVVTMKDGSKLDGSVAAPIYLDSDGSRHIYILHKRQTGEDGQALTAIVYVKSVRLGD